MKLLHNFIFLKLERVYTYKSYVFVSQATHLRVCEIQLLKGALDHDFNRSTKASVKSFESYRQLVILFWGPNCIKNTFYVIAFSIPFVLSLFWSVLFEKLDCKHLRGSHLLTFLWISRADLYVTSRWPDTSDFHSPIPALVPRPKFITPSW